MGKAHLPLSGMTVLDLSRLLPGPLCSMHLVEMGARVIKVEDTGMGDYARTLGAQKGSASPMFQLLNRNKESISVDLTKPEGLEIVLKLVEQSDVVLESFRPGVMDKLGLGYDKLKSINPKIVVCAISGFGQTGPWALKAGHDMNYCATSGLLDQVGSAESGPVLSNFQIADIAGGALSAAMAIVAGLLGAERQGEGCYLDISMTDCAFANNMIPMSYFNATGKSPCRGQDLLTGGVPCYRLYETQDGRHMAVGSLELKFWQQVCEILGQPEWAAAYGDFMGAATNPEKLQKTKTIEKEVEDLFKSQPQSHWRELFADSDCCVTPILNMQEVFEHPQLLAREMIQELNVTANDKVLGPAPAIKYGAQSVDAEKILNEQAGPDQGEHTLAILRELSFGQDQIDQLTEKRVVKF